MRKLPMISMAALLVLAMSCKKNEVENNPVGSGFRASLESQSGDSKTHLENGYDVMWNDRDAIRVVNANGDVADFRTNGVTTDGYADFLPIVSTSDEFYKPAYKAYYPESLYDAESGKVSLPATQVHATVNGAGSFGNGYNPMAACDNNKFLHFKNICGMLVLNLKGTCKVSNIVITSKVEENLWGKGNLTLTSTKVELGTLSEGSKIITLNCNSEQLTETAKSFYFVLPAGSLASGFDVVLTDSEGKVWKGSASTNTLISQNKITRMPALTVVTKTEGELSGKFSVSPTKQITFSQGNLQFQASTGTWRFAPNQWDIIGNVAGNTTASPARETQSAWVDLFGWGDLTGINYVEDYRAYSWTDDWGTKIGPGWRTLELTGKTSGEWYYLINGRNNAGNLRGEGIVNGVKGLIVLPDNWVKPGDVSFASGSNYSSNTYDSGQWAKMEAAGAVFLPSAGKRGVLYVSELDKGRYWSSTNDNGRQSFFFHFQDGWIFPDDLTASWDKNMGLSVRLVRDAN